MTGPTKVFHTVSPLLFKRVHIVLVRPEQSQNVGAVARAMANMGILTPLKIVSAPEILSPEAFRLARHASAVLEKAQIIPILKNAFDFPEGVEVCKMAITARVGSPDRPHPVWLPEAMPNVVAKMNGRGDWQLAMVFGPESDGLSNDEVAACDAIMRIPSDTEYRSLNLAQAVMVCCYEFRRANLMAANEGVALATPQGQKDRLIQHILQVAEAVGFVLPGDPYKMKGRLTEILSGLPNHLKDIKTLHGLLDQVARSLKKQAPDFKGRYRNRLEREADSERV
ncbi:MAG: hypothetical protein HYR96_05130 [Deltaproteobacteria bacterium]|nr:hypothetical protein [Deltaproteobacteria bacterium]MBI3295495.1 hypothetical protein [Deltaproteobacteria bacterium]